MSETDRIAESVNNIAQALSDLHGGAQLRDEIARLKAVKARQAGEIIVLKIKAHALEGEIDRLRGRGAPDVSARNEAANERLRQRMGDLEVELKNEIKKRDEKLVRMDTAVEKISDNNSKLRAQLSESQAVARRYRADSDKLRDVVSEVDRAMSGLREEG